MPSICAAFVFWPSHSSSTLQDVRALELVERRHVIAGERRERGAGERRARAGDVGDVEHVARGEDHRALDRVLELAHVAGPRLRGEVRERGSVSTTRPRSARSAACSAKCRASSAMSPGRSRSGGTSIVITASR